MHYCLTIHDILETIFLLIDQADPERRTGTLAALARVCTIFEEPALNALWRRAEIRSLLRCMPENLFEDSVRKAGSLRLVRPMRPSDWERPLLYAHRVRYFSYGSDSPGIPAAVFAALASSLPPPRTVVFPQLRSLTWGTTGLAGLPWFRIFLSPTLQTIHLLAEPAIYALSILPTLLPTLLQSCPALEAITLLPRTQEADSAKLAEFLCSVSESKCTRLNTSLPNWETLESLTRSSTLEHLTVNRVPSCQGLQPRHVLPTFSALKELDVLDLDICETANLIFLLRDAPLQSLKLRVPRRLPAQKVQTIHNSLASAFLPGRLRHLELRYLGANTNTSATPAHATPAGPQATFEHSFVLNQACLLPLFVFSELTSVSITSAEGFSIDDFVIVDLAQSWPRLERLTLVSLLGWYRPHTTLACLQSFAQHCPALEHITLSLDATRADTISSNSMASTPQTNLITLNVAHSHISADCIAPAATYLSALFPNLMSIATEYRPERDYSGGAAREPSNYGLRSVEQIGAMKRRWEYVVDGLWRIPGQECDREKVGK